METTGGLFSFMETTGYFDFAFIVNIYFMVFILELDFAFSEGDVFSFIENIEFSGAQHQFSRRVHS